MEVSDIARKAAFSLGYCELKSKQEEVICSILQLQDVFCVLPTGYGKTLCFSCLPAAFDMLHSKEAEHSLIIVVSPLKALIEDQVSLDINQTLPSCDKLIKALSCTRRGVSVGYVTDETVEDVEMRQGIECGKYQIVYFTPESLILNKRWIKMLKMNPVYQTRLTTIVFDEAHCIKKW